MSGDRALPLFAAIEPAAAPPPVAAVPVVPDIPFTWSEAHRHACEVRLLVSKGRSWSVDFCRGVEDKRGRAAAEQLWLDARREAKRVGAWLKS